MAKAFRDSEELLQALLDNVVDGLVIIDHRGIIQEFNRAAEGIFGYTAREMVGKNVAGLMPEPDRSNHDRYVENYLRTGVGRIIGIGREVVGQRKDGRTFPMDLSIGEMRHEGQRFFIGMVRDVTERKQREELLRQAFKMEALGQLTGGVAHDFNNLLAVLMMDLEILEGMTRDRKEEHDIVTEAREVAQAGAELTKRLLVFARNQPLDPQPTDLAELVRRLSDMLRRTLGDDIEIDTIAPAHLWHAEVDAGQLENALLNLAINSRDAMPSGGQLTISMENRTISERHRTHEIEVEPGDYVAIRVSDTGAGMSPDVLQRAFDPFFSTKTAEHGTGLGLSMVFGFVRQSGGQVKIESEVARGTIVELLLPRMPAPSGSTTTRHGADEGLARGTETVLLVEDHPQLRRRGERTLCDLGYRVLSAGDAHEALTLLSSGREVELLFTDIVLPGGATGPELAKKARSLNPDLKIIYTTGYAEHSQLPGSEGVFAAEILRKPYSRRDLADRLRKVLDGAGD